MKELKIGDSNSGDWNSGDWNSGDSNSGDSNSGHWNSGDSNSGHWNSGDSNSGNSNSGNSNSGNSNSGHWNSGHWNSGIFNSNIPNVRLFNRQSKVPWTDSRIQAVLGYGPALIEWVCFSQMTDAEKQAHPEAETTDGYLKNMGYKDAWRSYWGNSSQDIKDRFLNLPFFDPVIFEDITGVNVVEEFKSFKALRKSLVNK